MPSATEKDKHRYHRQILFPGWGEAGQEKLKASSVFIAGAGGLGSPVAYYLAAAGVGEIHICDSDAVELSNLNRQILHFEDRLGKPKATSASITLKALNPSIKVVPIHALIEDSTIEKIAGHPDILVDCLDNYDTRYLLNRYGIQNDIPLVHGALWGMTGQVSFFQPPETPCLRCLVSEAPVKETFPVIGATAGITGCIQALEVLKYLTGVGKNLKGKLLFFEGDDMTFTTFTLHRSPTCPDCGHLHQ